MTWSKWYNVLCICFVFSTCIGFTRAFMGFPSGNRTRKPALHYSKSWCQAISIQQVIEAKDCESKRIKNKACIGKCSSFYIPRVRPSDKNSTDFQRCKCCKPSLSTWTIVPLHCPNQKPAPWLDKMVEIISECHCVTCI